jgi:hypothetical protein
VLENFRDGAAWIETDEGETDLSTVIEDLLTVSTIVRCGSWLSMLPKHWSRDATENIAEELDRRISG